jgi:hypothetical protein
VFLKEVKSQLESDARDFVIRACRRKIRKMIGVSGVGCMGFVEQRLISD